jgi:hypothetical protein
MASPPKKTPENIAIIGAKAPQTKYIERPEYATIAAKIALIASTIVNSMKNLRERI